ncbi:MULTISPECIES: DUF1156 domain-containing protein [Rhodococcus]|uniref:DUF1156 domain-containing protein n=1 Tax=Rhodococcus TaxID=1827 RepID=UPI00228536CA|nr:MULTISPECIES: DUF1156 domain-containing protein [Rhodococcus]MDV6297343.1 DUF1156 domain-containing protein [Rhodococcus aetherivorans]WAL49843.1 DUF1156 domain-containing protein [Rhodococcus pyridinivorans]
MTADTTAVPRRKLIEVALPLEKINAESAREKSIRHGHPSTLHLWWSRKPLATARAVLFAQLVDDPSSHPDRFPTDEAVATERKRLHELIEQLVAWENTGDQNLLRRAHEEILSSTNGNPPAILDPFAGGGSIPLEAQRLGLEAHASDLNPVAVLINKALIEIPPKFAGRPPVFPGAAEAQINTWPRATGLAEDVRRYGQWVRDEAQKRIGHLYPKANVLDGTAANVIAWIWARTVTCPNPACSIEMPLTSSWWLGKKKGKEAYVVPVVADGEVHFTIGHDVKNAPTKDNDGTVRRTGATCIGCGAAVEFSYIRTEGRAGRLGAQLMAIVAEGKRTRIYLAPTDEHENAARVPEPVEMPDGYLPTEALGFRVQPYGMTEYTDLFTLRQLTALTTFSDLIGEARERVLADTLALGLPEGASLESGGTGAAAYADAVATYLGFAISRMTNKSSSICSWDSSTKMEAVRSVFARQALSMSWDFAESSPWGGSGGDYLEDLLWISRVLDRASIGPVGQAWQSDAQRAVQRQVLISTDPPYYDNIGYSDLSDFFYVWLRRSLRRVHPELLSTMLVPKADELVANPYRHGGKDGAHVFFESGFREVFSHARESAFPDYPITVYYAFKQQDVDGSGEASTGWETLLEGMIRSGWMITATWPMRSELSNRMRSFDSNSLASSIVLALRPRTADAPTIDRRGFINALKDELPQALRDLQQGAIAPVDLPQAAIGPGMAVFSRFSGVLTDDGAKMTVRSALTRINEILDEVLAEQEGDFDSDTRFAIAWFRQHGFEAGKFGDADNMARARNASLEHLERSGILISRAGKVSLLSPSVLGEVYVGKDYDPAADPHISTWEVVMHLARALTEKGVPAAASLLSRVPASIDRDLCKELAFLLFTIAEDAKRTQVAVEFNSLGTAWNDIVAESRTASTQLTLDA